MKISATAPGKLVLLGEYAVLENSPAIVTAVNRRATITIEQTGQDISLLNLPHLKDSVPLDVDGAMIKPLVTSKSQLTTEVVNRVVSMLNRIIEKEIQVKTAFHGVKLTIDSSDFFSTENNVKLGLGSSAAVTVGLLAAVRKHINAAWTNKNALMHVGYRQHNESQHQAGSGIDIAASVFGGVLRYRAKTNAAAFSPVIKKVSVPEDLQMGFVWTGRAASTVSFLKRLKDFKINKPTDYNRSMRWLVRLAQAGCQAFEQSDTTKFLQTVERFYHCLEDLGNASRIPIISNNHRRIARIIYQNGGYYKPSSAGGGDFGIIFSNQKSRIDRITNLVENAGFSFPKLSVSADGVCVRGSKED
jgi:phosphomevalonate kinase